MKFPDASTLFHFGIFMGFELAKLQIGLLGVFQLSIDGKPIDLRAWNHRKARNLIKLLALAPGHRLHREQLMELLWPNSDPQSASNSLRQTLHLARKGFETAGCSQSGFLQTESGWIELHPAGELWIDADEFELQALGARREKTPQAYRTALALYRGDLLPDDRYEDWAEPRREALRQLCLALHIELAKLDEERGEFALAIAAIREAVAMEPTHEEAQTALVRCYARSGARSQALRQYEVLKEALRKDLDLEPSESVQALYQEILENRFPSPAPPPDPAGERGLKANRCHNLPESLTSFIGREKEIQEVKRLLARYRLVNLTGMGGSGKTRLAIQAAKELVELFPQGVWLVELAGIDEAGLVVQAVANELGVREQVDRPLEASLVSFMKSRQLLLILDNCEHVIASCAALADRLLRASPDLRILATSRQVLGIRGEVVWQVPGLSLPEPFVIHDKGGLDRYEAIQLLIERARLVQPNFSLTEDNLVTIARVCIRLDGIPLGIELAAARLKVLSVEQLEARISDFFGLLTGGGRVTFPRQQTLQATLDWSHALLSEREQIAFRRLAVFAGSFRLAAAESVCAGNGLVETEILDLLSSLVDKSLVEVQPAGQEVRYRLLEIVRQYAHLKLAGAKEQAEFHRRHLHWFLNLAEAAEPQLIGPGQPVWLNLLDVEQENLRAALHWSLQGEVQDTVAGTQLAGKLWWYWYIRGDWSEGRQWFEIQSRASIPSLSVEALSGAGWLALFQGDHQAMTEFSKEGLKLYRQLGEKSKIALFLDNLGMAAEIQGDYPQAEGYFMESLVLRRETGDGKGIPGSLLNLGSVVLLQGDYPRAAALLEECLGRYRQQQDEWNAAWARLLLGYVALFQDQIEPARSLFADSLGWFVQIGDRLGMNYGLRGVAGVAASLGLLVRAARLFGAAEALSQATHFQLPVGQREINDRLLAPVRGRLDESTFMTAWNEGQAMSLEGIVQDALAMKITHK